MFSVLYPIFPAWSAPLISAPCPLPDLLCHTKRLPVPLLTSVLQVGHSCSKVSATLPCLVKQLTIQSVFAWIAHSSPPLLQVKSATAAKKCSLLNTTTSALLAFANAAILVKNHSTCLTQLCQQKNWGLTFQRCSGATYLIPFSSSCLLFKREALHMRGQPKYMNLPGASQMSEGSLDLQDLNKESTGYSNCRWVHWEFCLGGILVWFTIQLLPLIACLYSCCICAAWNHWPAFNIISYYRSVLAGPAFVN